MKVENKCGRFGELYFRDLYFGERYFLLQKEADIVYEEAAHSTLRFEEFVLGVLSIFLLYKETVQCTMYIMDRPHTEHPGSGSGSHRQTTTEMTSVLRIL